MSSFVAKPLLKVDGLAVSYAGRKVVDHLSFELEEGEIGCLLGASGCGKTTVLRAIAGFEALSAGTIVLADRQVGSVQEQVPVQERQVGMVFQDYALFPHLTVLENVAFGLKNKDKATIAELLDLVGLAHVESRYPHQLSGGQQQRVALARALAPKPRLLLLDEPFSNLDVELRERLGQEVRSILKESGTTAILVTHDQREAFAMADRVGVMTDGALRQWASPYDLYHEPTDRFVANFIGEGVLLPAKLTGSNCIEFELGEMCRIKSIDCCLGCPMEVLIRPDDIVHVDSSPLKAEVVAKVFRGAHFLYTLALPSGNRVLSLVPSHHNHSIGEAIGIELECEHVIAFKK
jgi:iron(III) transport system ATP-binding protein